MIHSKKPIARFEEDPTIFLQKENLNGQGVRIQVELYERDIIFSFVPFELKTKLKFNFYLEFDPSSG